jgi:hypothetical protein
MYCTIHTKQSLALEVEGGPQVHFLPQVHYGVSHHLKSNCFHIKNWDFGFESHNLAYSTPQ